MHEESFQGLAIVAGAAFFMPLLLGMFPRVRLPSVVLEILAGVLIGPAVLGWVHVDGPITVISRLGLASLLFLAGMEIEVERLKGPVMRTTGWAFLVSLVLAALICSGLGAVGAIQTPLFVAILLTATGLGVIVPVLKDSGEIATPFGQLVVVAASIADFGTIILLALLFSAGEKSRATTVFLLVGVAGLCAIGAIGAIGLGRWKRLTSALQRLQDTTAAIRVRGAAFLLILWVAVVEKVGLEIILGAFAAGVLLSFIDRDEMKTHVLFRTKLQAIGFGVFIPVFFVTSGVQFNVTALLASPSSMAAVPLFLAALLLIRGIPALMYRSILGMRRSVAAGFLQATSLSFIVAGARIGVTLGRLDQATAAALIAAGMLSVLLFPLGALTLLQKKEP
jgi:Kef-type K+ transport system membrane component KefB